MNALYSPDPAEREAEAKKYRVFHRKYVKIPHKWRNDGDELLQGRGIEEGRLWPDSLLRVMRRRPWPEYTFSTANASCLVVLHRPGDPGENEMQDMYIEPALPVLGGISHAHNAFWYRYSTKRGDNKTWPAMHKYLPDAFTVLDDSWTQIMTTCLTTTPAKAGQVDVENNLRAVNSGLLDFLVELCMPRIILLCGGEVQKAARNWTPPKGIRIHKCHHPSYQSWGAGEGLRVQQAIRKSLFLYE